MTDNLEDKVREDPSKATQLYGFALKDPPRPASLSPDSLTNVNVGPPVIDVRSRVGVQPADL